MAAFFFLSGITYRGEETTFEKFVVKKFRTIMVPYFLFAIIMLMYLWIKKVVFHGYTFNIISGLLSIILPVSGRESTTVYGLWFLPCLFLSEAIMYIIFSISKNLRVRIIGYLILCLICIGIHRYTAIVSIMDILPIAVLYLGIGKYVQKKINLFEERHLLIGVISGILFLACVFLNYKFSAHSFDMSSLNLGIWPLYILSGIFGAFLISALSMYMSKIEILKKIGRDSISYYGLHYEIIGVMDKVFSNGYFQMIVTMGALYILIPIYKKICFYIIKEGKAQ